MVRPGGRRSAGHGVVADRGARVPQELDPTNSRWRPEPQRGTPPVQGRPALRRRRYSLLAPLERRRWRRGVCPLWGLRRRDGELPRRAAVTSPPSAAAAALLAPSGYAPYLALRPRIVASGSLAALHRPRRGEPSVPRYWIATGLAAAAPGSGDVSCTPIAPRRWILPVPTRPCPRSDLLRRDVRKTPRPCVNHERLLSRRSNSARADSSSQLP